jgi:hypothetical protein
VSGGRGRSPCVVRTHGFSLFTTACRQGARGTEPLGAVLTGENTSAFASARSVFDSFVSAPVDQQCRFPVIGRPARQRRCGRMGAKFLTLGVSGGRGRSPCIVRTHGFSLFTTTCQGARGTEPLGAVLTGEKIRRRSHRRGQFSTLLSARRLTNNVGFQLLVDGRANVGVAGWAQNF